MQLRIQARTMELPYEARLAIGRRLRLAIGRYAAAIDSVRLTLSPTPDVGEDPGSHCRIHVRMRRGPSFVVEDDARDPEAAAAWRLRHRLERYTATREVA